MPAPGQTTLAPEDADRLIEPGERIRFNQFLDLIESGALVHDARSQLGIHSSTLAKWSMHPRLAALYARVQALRSQRVDEVVYERALTLPKQTEYPKMYLQAHHPAYKKEASALTQVNITIQAGAVDRSKSIETEVLNDNPA